MYLFTPCTTSFARWCGSFLIFMSVCVYHRHVIVLGDINTAHKMIDHCDPDEEVKIVLTESIVYLQGIKFACSVPR